jgi:arginyl-tRNA synthetase
MIYNNSRVRRYLLDGKFSMSKTKRLPINIVQQITVIIRDSLSKLNLGSTPEIVLEHPRNSEFGDFSTNIALTTFSALGKNSQFSSPRDLAVAIVEQFKTDIPEAIKSVQVDGPGFINIHLTDTYLVQAAQAIIDQSETYGHSNVLKSQKIVIEFTDPNPFKDFHIGHLYTNTVGESIARLKESQGATVWRADYFGDVGMHVAKSIWGLIQSMSDNKLTLKQLSTKSIDERISYLGKAYARGATAYKDDSVVANTIKQINFLVYHCAQELHVNTESWQPIIDYQSFLQDHSLDQAQIFELYQAGRSWSLEYFDSIYERVGMKYDGYYPESKMGEYGYQIVKSHLNSVFEVGENGAIIFPGSKFGLHDRVFINSLGLPTYEAKELGLAPAKYRDFKYDQSLVITGNEINEYFKVLLKAMQMINPKLGESTLHIGHGMVRLPEGKMSSRTGNIIRGVWLLDEAKAKIAGIIGNKYPQNETDDLAEQVGQAAIKYAFLKQGIGEDIAFDLDTSISFEGDSGPYLQYTYARCYSVLKKSSVKLQESIKSETLNSEEKGVFQLLPRFPEVVAGAAQSNSPHEICTYLISLAKNYNTFYNKHTILGTKKSLLPPVTQSKRLVLTAATAQVIKNGLWLLGIHAPSKM